MKFPQKVWADPPLGWKYGFPKVWDQHKDPNLKTWLIANGYPEKDINLALTATWVQPYDEGEEL